MFTLDDSKVFATCQQKPKGVSIVDVSGRKEIKFIPIKGSRTGGMTPDGKYFLVGASKAVVLIDTATNEVHKTIKVPVGRGNFTCLPDGSKCYAGLRSNNSVGVIDMASLELIKVIKTGKNGNRLYLNPANSRYGIFTNESGKSEQVSVIDTQEDVKIKDIITGLGPHNAAFDPTGKFALVTTKKENVATLIDTSSANPADWDVITTDIAAGIQNNGVRWVPSPSAIIAAMKGVESKDDQMEDEAQNIFSATGVASISLQCVNNPCASEELSKSNLRILKLKATDVAKLYAMDELSKLLGVTVNSLKVTSKGKLTKNQIKTTSFGLLKGVRFSDPVFKGDEVSIEVTAVVK
jgi:YVTN family beta-propeller protein